MKAPFTDSQIESINSFQKREIFHPLTCGYCRENLEAGIEGLYCPVCIYTQDWVPDFILLFSDLKDYIDTEILKNLKTSPSPQVSDE
jgi:hypothetical protein